MAKALIGHVGGPDPRTVMELRRLQERVRSLEAELYFYAQVFGFAQADPVTPVEISPPIAAR